MESSNTLYISSGTVWVTLNNASDYWTNGLYRTPNPSPLAR